MDFTKIYSLALKAFLPTFEGLSIIFLNLAFLFFHVGQLLHFFLSFYTKDFFLFLPKKSFRDGKKRFVCDEKYFFFLT